MAAQMTNGADLSVMHKHSNGLVQWSFNGQYLAIIKDTRLCIRSSNSLQILQTYSCLDVVQQVEWSPDSQYVLVSMPKRNIIQLFSVSDSTWTCKINEGVAGMVHALWTPDSRHVCTIADFQLHLTIWSLKTRATFVIRNPKLKKEGITFSPDGAFVAVVERMDCKDFMGIYSCETWELTNHFAMQSYDVAEISWSPTTGCIVARDSSLEFNLFFYSPDGHLFGKYQAYTEALGIKCISWSPSGQLMAVGSYDQKIYLVNSLTWKPLAEFDHLSSLEKDDVVGYKQSQDPENGSIFFQTQDNLPEMTLTVIDPTVKHARHGVGIVAWSHDSKFLASRNDTMPNTLWIWTTESMKVHSVIVLLSPVKSARWSPHENRIAFCSGDNRVYIWSIEGTSWVDVPAKEFRVLGLRWNPDENTVALLGKDTLCCLFI